MIFLRVVIVKRVAENECIRGMVVRCVDQPKRNKDAFTSMGWLSSKGGGKGR